MKCKKCGIEIPEGRLKALPNTTVCTPCSTENPYFVNQVVKDDEDYTELEFIKDPNTIDELRKYKQLTTGHIPFKSE